VATVATLDARTVPMRRATMSRFDDWNDAKIDAALSLLSRASACLGWDDVRLKDLITLFLEEVGHTKGEEE